LKNVKLKTKRKEHNLEIESNEGGTDDDIAMKNACREKMSLLISWQIEAIRARYGQPGRSI